MTSDRLTTSLGEVLRESVAERLLSEEHLRSIAAAAQILLEALGHGGKLLVFGNGGSAADAQHIAAELVGRFLLERRPYAAVALTTNTSLITAIANDYAFEDIFARQVQALGARGDVVMGLSTSGASENVLRGLRAGRELGAATIGLTGAMSSAVQETTDVCIAVPARGTPRIQEGHLIVAHASCEVVERALVEGS